MPNPENLPVDEVMDLDLPFLGGSGLPSRKDMERAEQVQALWDELKAKYPTATTLQLFDLAQRMKPSLFSR